MNDKLSETSDTDVISSGVWTCNQRVCVCLLSRDPYRVRSGRTSVLRTAIHSLALRFGKVQCIIFEPTRAEEDSDDRPRNCELSYVGSPSVFQSFFGKTARLIRGYSLNEALFYSKQQMRLTRTVIDRATSLVYCDSLRLAQYASALDLPWILDLDDLLSARFDQFLRSEKLDVTQVLGHFASLIPKPLKSMLGLTLRPMLGRESRRLAAREVFWARSAPEACLVSSEEAATLGKLADRNIRVLPMAVPDVDASQAWTGNAWSPSRPLKLVFVGFLAYRPNIEAIEFLAKRVVPALNVTGIETQISVVGETRNVEIPKCVRDCSSIILRGFVADLYQEFDRNHAFIAPIFSGTGIKTKVLEAMRFGIPVVGTPMAFNGLTGSVLLTSSVGRMRGNFLHSLLS